MPNYQKNKKKIDTSPLKSYAKYSGIAFQMIIIIVLGTIGGYKLDEYFGFKKHILTLILSILSVVLAIYVA
ncbi:MAG: AtpZ/AtpI family protein, partial [Chlorobi bacterium]|nr:AtpZ/AtpI family protein [Chlorobiota bacterium]